MKINDRIVYRGTEYPELTNKCGFISNIFSSNSFRVRFEDDEWIHSINVDISDIELIIDSSKMTRIQKETVFIEYVRESFSECSGQLILDEYDKIMKQISILYDQDLQKRK